MDTLSSQNTHPEIKPPQHSPIVMIAVNVVFFGVPHLVMHLYKRFFIIFGVFFMLLLSSIYIPEAKNIIAVPMILLYLFVYVDCALQAQYISSGKIPSLKVNKILSALGLVCIFAFAILYTMSPFFESSL